MSAFTINSKNLEAAISSFDGIEKQLEKDIASIFSILNKISNIEIRRILQRNIEQLQDEREKIVDFENLIKQIVQLYNITERNIMNGNIKNTGNNADDKVDNNREMENEAYFTAMQDEYGFSKEEAELLKDAYDAFAASEEYSKLDNKEKIAQFFSNMAALVSGYSSESKLFSLMGSNPSKEDATKFFDNLGIDGAKLAEVVNQQHNNCGDNKDFAHECAMYSVMSCDNMIKGMAGLNDNIDDLVGFKGDIYSGSMKLDDIKSDIAGVNIYKRMLECEDGDIFKAFEDYNTEDINESLEFLENYGNGDAEKGLENIEKKINDSSLGTIYIQHSDMGNGEDKVEKLKEQFLDYLSTESGVSR